jgi:hypothetical protein|tara:strand:+ start:354 stop:791 length:438 start_codon:yes stop_codon:yes gene_type:complete
MPRSKVPRKILFRDFAKQDKAHINKNYLKRLKATRLKYSKAIDMDFSKIEFLLWGYDLQFFTMRYASKDFEVSESNIGKRYIFPLTNAGYLYKHFNRLTPSDTYEDHIFREETKYNYRVRYALTQKARLFVQRFYNDLEQHQKSV